MTTNRQVGVDFERLVTELLLCGKTITSYRTERHSADLKTRRDETGRARRRPKKHITAIIIMLVLVALLLTLIAAPTLQLDNGLALTPPMGWLNWERFTCQIDCDNYPDDCISSRLFEQMAERLVADGYAEAGYKYVNIDDCWSEHQREPKSERLVPNATRFPEGIGAMAHFMHSRGLKLGIYGDCGYKTCAGYPAQLRPVPKYLNDPLDGAGASSQDYFELDAGTFADWAIDSFKFDGCFIEATEAEGICPGMSRALADSTRRSGRPILLVCEWPFYMMYAHAEPDFGLAAESCNVWRYYDDIEDSWQSILNTIDYTVRHQSTIVKYHGPGHWFDPDQLVVGNFGLSWSQQWAQMALWCMWSAPLYMSNDLRKIDGRARQILTNRHLIAINQDKLGLFALMVKERHSEDEHYQAFVKPILPIRHECPSFALVYLNRNTLGGQIKVSFRLADLLTGAPLRAAKAHALELLEREPDDPVAQAAANFKPSRCLEWLRPSATHHAGEQQQQQGWPSGDSQADSEDDHEEQQPQPPVAAKFKVFDLVEGKYLFDERALGVEEELKLPVSPSGVRALRLDAV